MTNPITLALEALKPFAKYTEALDSYYADQRKTVPRRPKHDDFARAYAAHEALSKYRGESALAAFDVQPNLIEDQVEPSIRELIEAHYLALDYTERAATMLASHYISAVVPKLLQSTEGQSRPLTRSGLRS